MFALRSVLATCSPVSLRLVTGSRLCFARSTGRRHANPYDIGPTLQPAESFQANVSRKRLRLTRHQFSKLYARCATPFRVLNHCLPPSCFLLFLSYFFFLYLFYLIVFFVKLRQRRESAKYVSWSDVRVVKYTVPASLLHETRGTNFSFFVLHRRPRVVKLYTFATSASCRRYSLRV